MTTKPNQFAHLTPYTTASIEEIDRETSLKWLNDFPYPFQRPVSQEWVNSLAVEVFDGTFQQETTLILACVEGRWQILDGQHRLWAVAETDAPQSFIVRRISQCSVADAALIYSSTDIGRKRPPADQYRAMEFDRKLGLNRTQINALSSAVGFMLGHFSRQDSATGRIQRKDLIAGIHLYAPYARMAFPWLQGNPRLSSSGRRAATTGPLLVTARFFAQSAAARRVPSDRTVEAFWRGVATDDGIAVGDGRKVGYRHLIEARMPSGRIGGATMSPGESARLLGVCFGNYMRGIRMTKYPAFKVIDDRKAVDILGVPPSEEWFTPWTPAEHAAFDPWIAAHQ